MYDYDDFRVLFFFSFLLGERIDLQLITVFA